MNTKGLSNAVLTFFEGLWAIWHGHSWKWGTYIWLGDGQMYLPGWSRWEPSHPAGHPPIFRVCWHRLIQRMNVHGCMATQAVSWIPAGIDCCGEHFIEMKPLSLPLGKRQLPPWEYVVNASPIHEYILGTDALQVWWLKTIAVNSACKCVVKAELRGHAAHSLLQIPKPRWMLNGKQ